MILSLPFFAAVIRLNPKPLNSSIDYIDSSISEMDEVRAAAIVDLARRVAALEAASTTTSASTEHAEETEQTEQAEQ